MIVNSLRWIRKKNGGEELVSCLRGLGILIANKAREDKWEFGFGICSLEYLRDIYMKARARRLGNGGALRSWEFTAE